MSRADRTALIRRIEENRKSLVVAVVTGDRKGMETRIASDLLPLLDRHLEPSNRIDLFLYTPGGFTIAGYALVNLLREFCSELGVIVPFKALSCGTLVALGADEIVMTRMGQLSPIDPSVQHPLGPSVEVPGQGRRLVPVSVEDVDAFLDMARNEAGLAGEPALLSVFEILASNVNPLVLGAVQRSRDEIAFLASRLMEYHTSDEAKVRKVVDILTRERFSHSYLISRREAQQVLGLNILEPDPELDDLIMRLYAEYRTLLALDSPFNPEIVLGEKSETVATIDRAVVETKALTHVFRTRQRVKRIERLDGAEPAVGYLQVTLQEGWVEDYEA